MLAKHLIQMGPPPAIVRYGMKIAKLKAWTSHKLVIRINHATAVAKDAKCELKTFLYHDNSLNREKWCKSFIFLPQVKRKMRN